MASALGNDPDAIADTLLNHLGPHTIVLADKAYDADRIRELIQDQGATPNIPPKSNRRWKPCFSKRLYRERNLIERFFSLAANFLAMIQLASMRLWLRAYEYTAFFFGSAFRRERRARLPRHSLLHAASMRAPDL